MKQSILSAGCFFILAFLGASFLSAQGVTPVVDHAQQGFKEGEFTAGLLASKLNELMESRGIEAALELFDQVPEKNKKDEPVMYMHASLLLSAGKGKEAEKIGEELLKKNRKDVDTLYLNAMIQKSLGSRNKKSQYLKEIVAIEPNNAEANAELGNEQMTSKAYKLAKQYYLKSVQSNPNYITGLFGYGQSSYYLNDMKDAKTAFKRILEINPKDDIAWSYLAKIDAEDENYGEAIRNVSKAIEYNPTYYNYWIDYGDYLRLSAKNDEAIDAFSKAIEINPSYFLSYVYRAGLYEMKGDYADALEDYKTISKTNPQYYYAYESIGMLSWYSGEWAQCREAYEKAYEANKNNISYALMIAACYQKENNKLGYKNYLTKLMKGLDRDSVEYAVVRFYYDGIAEQNVLAKIRQQESRNLKGKLLYYMALYYDMHSGKEAAKDLYLEITAINAPMFFEYRLAEWALEGYGLAKL